MSTSRNRFVALMKLAGELPKHPALMMLIGYLCANLDRLRIVPAGMLPANAEVRIEITTPHARIWTGRWFRAWLGTAEVPDPVILISALTQRDDDIYLAIDYGAHVPKWLEEVLDQAANEPTTPRDRLEDLRNRVDHALDVYNECRRLLDEGDKEREKELRYLLETAKAEIQKLSQEIERLKAELPTTT